MCWIFYKARWNQEDKVTGKNELEKWQFWLPSISCRSDMFIMEVTPASSCIPSECHRSEMMQSLFPSCQIYKPAVKWPLETSRFGFFLELTTHYSRVRHCQDGWDCCQTRESFSIFFYRQTWAIALRVKPLLPLSFLLLPPLFRQCNFLSMTFWWVKYRMWYLRNPKRQAEHAAWLSCPVHLQQ